MYLQHMLILYVSEYTDLEIQIPEDWEKARSSLKIQFSQVGTRTSNDFFRYRWDNDISICMQCLKRSLKDESISFAIVDFKQDIILDMEMIYWDVEIRILIVRT